MHTIHAHESEKNQIITHEVSFLVTLVCGPVIPLLNQMGQKKTNVINWIVLF